VAIDLSLLPSGKVLAWGNDYQHFLAMDRASHRTSKIWTWDPGTNQYRAMEYHEANLFCGGHVFLPDGRLLVGGGHGPAAIPVDGLQKAFGHKHAAIYDDSTGRWAPAADMNGARYYPTLIELADGRVMAVAGHDQFGRAFVIPEVYDPATGRWTLLPGAIHRGYGDWYPYLSQLSDGRVYAALPGARTYFIDPNGQGGFSPGPNMTYPRRFYGTAVMYEQDKILVIGGNSAAGTGGNGVNRQITNTAEVIDFTEPNPQWRRTGSMQKSRWVSNCVLLPDGTVLVIGGTSEQSNPNGNALRGAVKSAELWDPATGRFTTLASMKSPRLYHSTAILLPDGRVLVAGGGQPEMTGEPKNAVHQDMQIFSPPYLFKGPRPTITSAPETLSIGQAFTIATSDAASITRVHLVKLGSVTHGVNMTQKIVKLPLSRDVDGTLRAQLPENANHTPPGHYLLFALSDLGVPSVGRVVQILA
jgi:hypothetical protein